METLYRNAQLQCRERHVSYKSKITVNIMYQLDGDDVVREETRVVGHMPIMVKSDRCNLRNLKPRQLIEKHEEVCGPSDMAIHIWPGAEGCRNVAA